MLLVGAAPGLSGPRSLASGWPGLAQHCRSTRCQTEPGPLMNFCSSMAQPSTEPDGKYSASKVRGLVLPPHPPG